MDSAKQKMRLLLAAAVPAFKASVDQRDLPNPGPWVKRKRKLAQPKRRKAKPAWTMVPLVGRAGPSYTRETYSAIYLKGGWWKSKRRQKLRSVGFRCEGCGAKGGLHVHHKHYDSLGRERNQDLEALCETCHHSRHKGWAMPAKRERPASTPWASFARHPKP